MDFFMVHQPADASGCSHRQCDCDGWVCRQGQRTRLSDQGEAEKNNDTQCNARQITHIPVKSLSIASLASPALLAKYCTRHLASVYNAPYHDSFIHYLHQTLSKLGSLPGMQKPIRSSSIALVVFYRRHAFHLLIEQNGRWQTVMFPSSH